MLSSFEQTLILVATKSHKEAFDLERTSGPFHNTTKSTPTIQENGVFSPSLGPQTPGFVTLLGGSELQLSPGRRSSGAPSHQLRYFISFTGSSAISAPAHPGVEPLADPGVEPLEDPGVEPLADPGMERLADPGVEPLADPGMEPLADPGVEPLEDPGVEPLEDPGVATSRPRDEATSGSGAGTFIGSWSRTFEQ